VYLPDRDVTTDAEEPSFSPDGAWVAYWSNAPEAETYDLWLVRADGSDNHQLTNTPLVSEAHPRFSVDGRWIYYIASQADGAWNLWRIRPDGSQSSKLTGYVAGQASVATISVGKSRVVFATQHFGPLQSVTLDGDKQQAIPGTDGASDPAPDPSGKRLLLVLQTVVGNPDVYSMNLDGTGLTNLTPDSSAADVQPIWSNGELGFEMAVRCTSTYRPNQQTTVNGPRWVRASLNPSTGGPNATARDRFMLLVGGPIPVGSTRSRARTRSELRPRHPRAGHPLRQRASKSAARSTRVTRGAPTLIADRMPRRECFDRPAGPWSAIHASAGV
jgi:hypothetical protein